MKITHLRINHLKNPLGYLLNKVTFSYKVTNAVGSRQTLARILVSESEDLSTPLYDSGLCNNIDSIAYTVELPLKPCTRYFWNVTVTTDAGETNTSKTEWFETGKLKEQWNGKWISSELNQGIHPIFFRKFTLQKQVQHARLYICGLGLYEAYIDNEKISDEFLTPYCNDYTQWLQYQIYDVTDMLKKGTQELSVLLGNGWYKGRFGLDDDGSTKNLYGDHFLLMAELHIEYTDGSKEEIVTDESWKARKSKIIESSFYDGEIYDETFYDEKIYPVYLWKEEMATLTERLSLPIRIQDKWNPIRILTTPKKEFVLDMGQNHSGWFELKVHEPQGTVLKLYFGEELQDGNFYNGNLRTGKQEYTYISNGNPTTIRPHFTTYGYRYVKLEGFHNFKEGDYKGLVLYSQLEETGQITTGNSLVNQLFKNAMWGQKSNFLDIPMDCPQRDERMGWTGDAQVFVHTACYNMDSYAFYRKYLYDMYQEQKHRNGAVPFVIPACGQENSCGIWGDAATIMPFALYENYGDICILEDQYESMKSWVDYIHSVNGEDWKWRKLFHFGDWLALDSRNDTIPTGGTDVGYVATVYYYHSVRLVAEAARILKYKKDAEKYKKLADVLLKEIQEEYFSLNGRLCIDTQTGYLLALKFGLSPNPARTKAALRESFKRNKDKLETGFVGTSMLCNVLSENGLSDLAYTLLLNEDYPGWLFSVKHGATTIWERWDSLDENGHFSPSGLNSLNHYSYGAIIEWMFRYSAGISPLLNTPGFREAVIEPIPDYRLGKIDARLESPIGLYRSSWEVTKDFGLKIDIEVPFGGTAYFIPPLLAEDAWDAKENPIFKQIDYYNGKRCCILNHGCYQITYKTIIPMRKTYGICSSIRELMGGSKTKEIIFQVLPMITMLPETLYDSTLEEMLQRDGKFTPEQFKEIDKKLMEIIPEK